MNGFLTIIEGPGKGTSKPLSGSLMIVGRSKNADLQVEDPQVSRRHLEIKVEAEGVFVENKSAQTALLNGKALMGVVSLNAGDVLQIGDTQLRFEAKSSAPVAAAGPADEAEIDGTRLAPESEQFRARAKEESASDETRAVVEDGTRMLNPSELPNWVAHKESKEAPKPKSMLGWWLLLILLLLGGGGGYYYWNKIQTEKQNAGALMAYQDALYNFSLSYPIDWTKTDDETGVVAYGTGKEGDNQWARITIFTDKDPQHLITGLTDGFNQYKEVLKKRHNGFSLANAQVKKIHNATGMAYEFSTATGQGLGFYLLNGSTRIVIECTSATASYSQNAGVFSGIFKSFQFNQYDPQLYIEFPQPDTGQQQLALSNPPELARQANSYLQTGKMLFIGKDVNPDNLYNSIHAYRSALQLIIAGPERLPSYREAAEGLSEATRLFNQQLQSQEFEISRAMETGDGNAAYWAANKLMQMDPDKTDDVYREAAKIVNRLQPQ
jgi:pSer/pThr/pTyr-binding forkhead associated (FHA) protein